MIEAARGLIHDRGYSAIGVAQICEHAEVHKGSFYHFFPSKQALAVATVRDAWDSERQTWIETLSDPGDFKALEALIREQARVQRSQSETTGFVVGCLYGNLALETNQSEQDLRDALRTVFDEQCELILGFLERAAEAGIIDAREATRNQAQAIISQLEGAAMLAKLYDDASFLDRLWGNIERLFHTLQR